MISDERVTELCASVQRGENSLGTAIRTACAEAVAIEREECAKVCDEGVKCPPNFPPNMERISNETAALLAKALRARGKVR